MSARYAIYFSPASQSQLAFFGETCLGRTAQRIRDTQTSSTFSDRERWLALTEKPAHYGFHATLKAPFELRNGSTEEQLIQCAQNFALNETAIELKTLGPRQLSHFLALTLDQQTQTLSAFAQRCVEVFDAFRQPLSEADRQRRLQQSLSERQIELMDSFGYPFVAEQFRFHMTLSGKLGKEDGDFVEWVSANYDSVVADTPVLDRIALFTQADRQSPFVHLLDFPFKQS